MNENREDKLEDGCFPNTKISTSPMLVNAVVTPDGTRLESLHRHDYKSYQDQNGETYVLDGGLDYIRKSVNKVPARDACVYADDAHELIRAAFKWGTRGKNGDEPISYVPIARMTNEHIENILTTQHHIRPYVREVFKNELKYRNGITEAI